MGRFRYGSPRATEAAWRGVLAGVLVSLGAAAPAAAGAGGEPISVALPPVEPGAVATAAVDAGPVLAAGERATYRIEPAVGVRVFGPVSGTVDALPGEALIVPLTYAVDAARPSGRHAVARLTVVRTAGETWEADLWTVVNTRRRLEIVILADPPVVEPGGRLRLSYLLTNRGNAPDSVRLDWDAPAGWSIRPAVDAVVVGAGAAVAGEVQAHAPAGARAGSVHTIRLNVGGRGGGAHALTIVTVQAGGGGRAELPATLLVGAGPGGAGGAFRAQGTVGDRTRIEAAAAYNVAGLSQTVPLPESGAPAFRLGIERPTWRAAVGEARLQPLPMLGAGFAGTGLEGAWSYGTVTTTVAALGLPSLAGRPDDRLLHVHARRDTELGLVGTTATAAMRERIPGSPSLVVGGGGTYQMAPSPLHRLAVEAGLMYVRPAPDSAGALGPSLVAAYELTHPAGGVVARLRRVPSGGPAGEVLPNETYVGARRSLPADLSAFAWGVRTDGGGFLRELRSEAASAGVDWSRGLMRLGLAGSVRRTSGFWRGASNTRNTVLLSAGYHRGQARLDLNFESGRSVLETDSSRAFRSARAGAHWVAGNSWAWTTLAVRSGDLAGVLYQLDVGARLVESRANVSLGASSTWGWGGVVGTAWASIGVAITSSVEVVAAGRLDLGRTGGPGHLSLAVRRRFGVPVPARPAGAAYGTVFEDLDGDGLAGPGEAGVPGVVVRLGAFRAVTDGEGRWVIRDAATQSGAPAVDVASLPAGLMPHGVAAPAGAGRSDLAVVRAATLIVHVFEDADSDAMHAPGERGAAGATVTVEDASGRTRWAEVDAAGRATFAGMPPGLHGVTVRVPAAGRRPASERIDPVTLSPGGEVTVQVPVASSERRVRFGRQD